MRNISRLRDGIASKKRRYFLSKFWFVANEPVSLACQYLVESIGHRREFVSRNRSGRHAVLTSKNVERNVVFNFPTGRYPCISAYFLDLPLKACFCRVDRVSGRCLIGINDNGSIPIHSQDANERGYFFGITC